MKIALVVAIYLLFGYWQFVPALRRNRREATLVAGITLLGALYSVGFMARWTLVNPVAVIELVFGPAARLLGMP